MNFIKFIRQDNIANKGNTKGKFISSAFRIANYCNKNKIAKIILTPYLFFYKIFFEWILGVEIPYNIIIGSGLQIFHGQGLVINKETVIGNNVKLRHNTTIGNSTSGGKCPVIEDNVNVGANCVIIGNITIGKNSIIGAGSVVVNDIPIGSVAVGNPARVIRSI